MTILKAALFLAFSLSCPIWAAEIEARVIQREDLWDRRSNPLMGRPDRLKEIRLKVETQGDPDKSLELSIKGHALLLQAQALRIGSLARFRYSGSNAPFEVKGIALIPGPKPGPDVRPTPRPSPKPRPTPRPGPGLQDRFPNDLKARDLQASPRLRHRAAKAIANRYGLDQAKVIFLSSFQGPHPPEGGYLYWGVTGKIRGLDHVWQQGETRLRPGTQLLDPKRHQK